MAYYIYTLYLYLPFDNIHRQKKCEMMAATHNSRENPLEQQKGWATNLHGQFLSLSIYVMTAHEQLSALELSDKSINVCLCMTLKLNRDIHARVSGMLTAMIWKIKRYMYWYILKKIHKPPVHSSVQ
jgi:hypothetical protein